LGETNVPIPFIRTGIVFTDDNGGGHPRKGFDRGLLIMSNIEKRERS
jgi:hypothetical protein